MAVKKSKRGLGRGLSALIQNTEERPDDIAAVPDASVDEVSVEQAEPTRAESTGPAQSTEPVLAPEDDTSGAAADDSEEAKSGHRESDDAERRARDVSSRYLGTTGQGQGKQSPKVPRETRRPVDVFFPERTDDDTKPTTPRSGAAEQSRSRGRRSVPDLSLPRSRSSIAADALLSGSGKKSSQPEQVGEPATDLRPPLAESGATGGVLPDGSELRALPVGDVHPNPRQPREVFDEEDMDELVASIREVGVLQPVVVRPVQGDSPYELVMGERRWRASQKAGLTEIPAIIRHTSDEDLLRDALLENLHRSQLNPLEEAAAYQQLLEDFSCTQEELSARIGRSRPQISNTLRLMKLPPLVQRRVASGVLSAGHARALLSLSDPSDMERLAQKIVSEGMSVRATEELVAMEGGLRQPKTPQRARTTQRHERLDYWASSLTDELDTTVKITLGARKGKIAIDFASVEDLHRIMGLIQPSTREKAE